jgi:hypothetical protein
MKTSLEELAVPLLGWLKPNMHANKHLGKFMFAHDLVQQLSGAEGVQEEDTPPAHW